MSRHNDQPIDLESAQRCIVQACPVLPAEELALAECVGRFPGESLKAIRPLPGYDQSLRDGYAIAGCEQETQDRPAAVFRIVGEVAAGDTRKTRLARGEAVRIMTGALLPVGSRTVVPQELCELEGEGVRVPRRFLEEDGLFIHARGSEFAKGRTLVAKGSVITAERQILLAGGGYEKVGIARVPRVAFFCTGSELVTEQGAALAGRKISANSALLSALITHCGCKVQEQRTVMDDPQAVLQAMGELGRGECDILISTGGMGPGKFDLVEEAFARAGGKTLYRSLRMRPGKSTLFGTLGATLFFGLPGPPPAAHFLFNMLVWPAILALQGAKSCRPVKVRAHLTEDLHLPKSDLPRMKSGILHCRDGKCLVRPAGRGEGANCYILCPAPRRRLRRAEKVTLHLLGEPPCAG